MMRRIVPVLLLALFCAAAAEEAPPRFAVYRCEFVEDGPAPPLAKQVDDPRLKRVLATQEYALATAVIQGPPVLTEADIEAYCWSMQQILLTETGRERWLSLGGLQVPPYGLPLLVSVDGEPVYAALAWNPASSLGCLLPQFMGPALEGRLWLRLFGRTPEERTADEAATLRHPRVEAVLRELGLLVEECP